MIREAPRKKRSRKGRFVKKECFKTSMKLTMTVEEQGVDGEERCEGQPCLVVACLELENPITEQQHDKKKICLLF